MPDQGKRECRTNVKSRFIGPENLYGSHSFATADQNRKFEVKRLVRSVFKRVVCPKLCILLYKALAYVTSS